MEAPVFGDVKPGIAARKKQRRYSWSTAAEEEEATTPLPKEQPQMSPEMANVLWGGMFQAMSDRILPTKTVGDAVGILADVADKLSVSSTPTDPSSKVPLKLVEAHMTNKSADVICAGVGHEHGPPTVEQPKALLLRRNEIYDLVLVFDRRVDPGFDQIGILLELEDQLFAVPGFNMATFPVTPKPSVTAKGNVEKNWWANFVSIREKKATISLHVCNAARVGKWRMKVLTAINRGDGSPKKEDRDMSVAFQRLHIAMNPDQIGKKANAPTRRFSKNSMRSKED